MWQWHWLAVTQVPNLHNQLVLSRISHQIWRVGSQDYLYSGNYRRKKKHAILFRHSFFCHWLPFSAEALWVCEIHHSFVLAFPFFFFLITFCPPLLLSSVPNLLTSSLPTPLLRCLFLKVIRIYVKDLSPSFSPALCPPFPSMSWRFNRTSYCCSVSRECPTPCWGWGMASLRSRTGKWPRWPKWPPGRTRCGRQQTTLSGWEIVIMRKIKNID